MKILITGNMGYVGPAVSRRLRAAFPHAELIGYDTGLFAHCLTGVATLPELALDAQVFGDVRDITPDLLAGADAVVHLAAISNDPMGSNFSNVTRAVNQDASIALGRMAAAAGVRAFVFASSCSVYGVADGPPRREQDPLNPVTAYASSKIGTETGLAGIDTGMTVTCLRFATACGMSDRLRLDLVLNDFVAGAITSGRITLLSDGTPWRPLIDTQDMARAIEWAVARPADQGGRLLTVNVGANAANYRIADLAHAVAEVLPGTGVSINHEAPADSRSYRVDFGLFEALAPSHQPQVSLRQSIAELAEGLRAAGFADPDFRNSQLCRLRAIERHRNEGRLDPKLRWAGNAEWREAV